MNTSSTEDFKFTRFDCIVFIIPEKDTNELKLHLEDKEAELQQLMEEKEDLEKDLAQLPDLKQLLKQKEEEVENLLKVTSVVGEEAHYNEIEKLKSEVKSLAGEIATCQKEKEEMENGMKEVEELERKLRNKDVEVVNLTLEKEEMMTSLEELDNQHQEAMTQIIKVRDNLSKSNEELKNKLRTAEAEVHSVRSEFDSLKQQHLVNQSVESSDSNELNHQIAELKEENNELRQKIGNCDTTILELTEDIMLKDREIEEMNQKMLSSAAALNDLHMDKQELENKVIKMKEEISLKVQEIKKLRISLDSIKTETDHSKASADVNTEMVREKSVPLHSTYNAESEKEVNELKQELGSIQAQYQDTKNELQKRTSECAQVQSDIHVLKSELENQVKSKESSQAECQTLSLQIKKLESDFESLNVSFTEKISELATVQGQLKELEIDRNKLQKESDRKSAECESFSRQIHSLEDHVTRLKDKISDLESENCSKVSEVDSFKQDLLKLQSDIVKRDNEHYAEIKALTVKLDTASSESVTKQNEIDDLTQLNETLSSEVSVLKEVISEKEHDCDRLNSQLSSSSRDLHLVKEELDEKCIEIQSLTNDFANEKSELLIEHSKEADWLKTQISSHKKEKEDLQDIFEKDICDLKEEHEIQLSKLEEENKELTQANKDLSRDLAGIETNYKDYIEKLKSSNDSDHSGLQAQYNSVLEDSHKKDLTVNSLETKLSSYEDQLSQCKEKLESVSESKNHISDLLKEKENEVLRFKELVSDLEEHKQAAELEKSEIEEAQTNEKRMLIAKVQEATAQMELTDECKNLKLKLKESEEKMQGLLEEKNSTEIKIKDLETELDQCQQSVRDYEAGIAQLNQENLALKSQVDEHQDKWQTEEGMVHVLKHTSAQKDFEIQNLQRKLHRAKSFVDEEQQKVIESDIIAPNYELPALEYKEKGEIELLEVCETIQPVMSSTLTMDKGEDILLGEAEQHRIDVTKEIDNLKDQLSEKDNIIAELQRNNSSFLKLLENKSKTSGGDTNLLEIHKLETEIKSLKKEREQMMDVMNEKTKEVSSLKAEVHRLMNIISAEKNAIEKLQRDNQEMIKKPPDTGDPDIVDMQKETIHSLSQIIRDKDLEIESLKQKSDTLLSVLQESSKDGNQINSLMVDKDNLTKQIAALQSEREQMIVYLNQKHQESVAYHNEVQRLTAMINMENVKNEQVVQEYEKLIPQFEDKTQALLKTQNELINYKQKYTELEVKCGQLLQQTNTEENVDKATFNSKTEELVRLQERYKELVDSVKEKEMKIQNLHQSVNELEQNFRSADHERAAYKKQVDNFVFQLHGLQTEQKDHKSEIVSLKHEKVELNTENKSLKELNNKLTLELQNQQFEVQSLQEKNTTLTAFLQERQGDQGQLDNLIQENEVTQQRVKQIQQERDQAVLALQNKQSENDQLCKDVGIYSKTCLK